MLLLHTGPPLCTVLFLELPSDSTLCRQCFYFVQGCSLNFLRPLLSADDVFTSCKAAPLPSTRCLYFVNCSYTSNRAANDNRSTRNSSTGVYFKIRNGVYICWP